jgi:hypothetical protein
MLSPFIVEDAWIDLRLTTTAFIADGDTSSLRGSDFGEAAKYVYSQNAGCLFAVMTRNTAIRVNK